MQFLFTGTAGAFVRCLQRYKKKEFISGKVVTQKYNFGVLVLFFSACDPFKVLVAVGAHSLI